VIGLDVDAASIEATRSVGDDIEYRIGDLFDRVGWCATAACSSLSGWRGRDRSVTSVSCDVLADGTFRRVPYFRYDVAWTRPSD